jgi:hypothetical protein
MFIDSSVNHAKNKQFHFAERNKVQHPQQRRHGRVGAVAFVNRFICAEDSSRRKMYSGVNPIANEYHMLLPLFIYFTLTLQASCSMIHYAGFHSAHEAQALALEWCH